MDVNFAKGLEAWAVAEGLTVDTTGHVEARILRALRALATVAGQGGFVAFNNEVLTLLTTIAASAGGGDADSVGGFTPGTAGGAVLESETAADVRTAAGLGSIATQAADSVSISGGSVTGITDVAVADGGTGASTAAGARDNIVFASSGVVNPASPYTVAAGVNRITLNASGTIVLPALSSYADVQPIVVINGTSSAITVTFDPDGTETIDGGGAGTSAAYTVAARGSVGAVRLSATAWGSVQSGSVGATRLRGYISDGVWYAVAQGYTGSAWVDVGSPVAATSGGAGGLTTLSGSTWSLSSGATAVAKPDPATVGAQGRVWYWALSAFSLPTFSNGARVSLVTRVGTRPTAAYAAYVVTVLSGAWTTSGQTQVGLGLTYQINKSLAYVWGGNNFGTATDNANFDELYTAWNVGPGTGAIGYRTTNKVTAAGISAGVSAGGSTPTHIGVSLCAIGGTTVAQADFVSPEWYLSVVDA